MKKTISTIVRGEEVNTIKELHIGYEDFFDSIQDRTIDYILEAVRNHLLRGGNVTIIYKDGSQEHFAKFKSLGEFEEFLSKIYNKKS